MICCLRYRWLLSSDPSNPAYTTAGFVGPKSGVCTGAAFAEHKASGESEVEAAFATMFEHRVGALLVGPDAFFNAHADQLVALTARYRIPASYWRSAFVKAGGLISYGVMFDDTYRTAGNYVGRIL